MRPVLLKGHERCVRALCQGAAAAAAPALAHPASPSPLTFVKYNLEGDLLVTCAKDHTPNLWYSDDGERIGTFSGHNGPVWTCDLTGELPALVAAVGLQLTRRAAQATRPPW